MPREDGAVILDAALALDHAGKQVAIDAQHRGHHPQQGDDEVHGHPDVALGKSFGPVCDEGISHRDDHPEQHGAQHPADRAFHRLFGADLGAQFVPAEGAARKIGAGVPAPGEAQHQQDEENGVVAVFRHRQQDLEVDQGIKAEQDDPGKKDQPADLLIADAAVAHHQVDAVEQQQRKGHRHHALPRHLIAGQHDQQSVGHLDRVQQPVPFVKAEGGIHFVHPDQGHRRHDQVKKQCVEGQHDQHQDGNAHNGCNHSCFHRFSLYVAKLKCRRTGGTAGCTPRWRRPGRPG